MNWTLTRRDNQARLELEEDLQWENEFTETSLAQTAPQITLGGAMIVEQGIKMAGRPITLGGDWVWHRLGLIRTLQDWSEVPALKMELKTPDGRKFPVIFARPALTNLESVVFTSLEDDNARYQALKIHFLTV